MGWIAAGRTISDPRCAMVVTSPLLKNLVRQLRQHSASSSRGDDDMDERGKVFSQAGVPQSATPHVGPCRADAAVLVCLFEGIGGDLRVMLTKRSSNLSTHPGEVSLPGGKVDSEDADVSATALREAKEEIGLDPALVTVATVLEPFLSKHHLRVVPVIGILSDKQAFQPVVNANEVETIFDAPLEMFLKDRNRRSEEREIRGNRFLIHFFDYEANKDKFVIWGLTAAILVRAASVVYKKPPEFPDHVRFIAVNKL